MKVLDLQCAHSHSFEGWFASEDDFQDQLARGLVTCPLCGDGAIRKKLSAPRLNLSTARGEPHTAAVAAPQVTPEPAKADVAQTLASMSPEQMQAAWLQMTRHVLAHTEDVGERFADEARRMHHGEAAHRNIRGQASAEETEALLEEGVSVMPLLIPEALKGPVQ